MLVKVQPAPPVEAPRNEAAADEDAGEPEIPEGGMTDFKDLMRQAQEVRDRFQRLQEELGGRTVEGSAGGGMVVAVMNGRQELLSVRIEKEVVSPDDVGMLQDLVRAAVNDALARSREVAAAEMAKVTGGMLPPGIL